MLAGVAMLARRIALFPGVAHAFPPRHDAIASEPKSMRRSLLALAAMAALSPAAARAGDGVRFDHEGAVQLLPQSGAFWGLAERFAPDEPYDESPLWAEIYAKGRWRMGDEAGTGFYGAASLLLTGTVGTDVFGEGDTGRARVEEAYVGWRGVFGRREWTADLSVGSREFRFGEGMLVATGGGNGFERGALTLAPHRAWSLAAVATLEQGAWRLQAFHLDPDELDSGDTRTRLQGVRAQWTGGEDRRLGLAWTRVPQSEAPYPTAPLGLIEDGREGLRTWSVDGAYEPTAGVLAGWSFRGEFATQRSDNFRMDAWGGIADVGYRFATARYLPRISYSPRYFSGDDPATPNTLERFDPLFYDGSPSTWSSGGNGSLAFYNSNLFVQRVRLDLMLSERDFFNIAYYDVRVAETNSPVQYGQAARLAIVEGQVGLVSGFPDRKLTAEWYAEYTRVLTPHWYLTVGLASASPRAGLKAVVNDPPTWWGGLLNLSWKY